MSIRIILQTFLNIVDNMLYLNLKIQILLQNIGADLKTNKFVVLRIKITLLLSWIISLSHMNNTLMDQHETEAVKDVNKYLLV